MKYIIPSPYIWAVGVGAVVALVGEFPWPEPYRILLGCALLVTGREVYNKLKGDSR